VLRRHGIDECVRLPTRIDAPRLEAELDRLPADTWGGAGRDPVVLASVDSFYAFGYPRGPRPRPAEDREILARLPYLREILHEVVPATPRRAIVARLAPGGLIPIHTDTARFFGDTLRLSIQVAREGPCRLYCDARWYDLGAGEVWAIDNLRPHGIHNGGARPRVNVLVDYLPSDALVALVAAGGRGLGARDERAEEELRALSRARYRAYRWRGIRYEIFKRLWRR
jgi:hypothetical protein